MIPSNFQITPFIAKKRDGGEHSREELRAWLEAYLSGLVKDYQMAAWLMAVFFRGMTPAETVEWTRLMWKSGRTFPRAQHRDYWIDKHSTGGVGDKTSLCLVPIVTSVCRRLFGKGHVRIPMVSGRGLGHSGGTLDKLESVPGFRTNLAEDEAFRLLQANDFFMMGQTEELTPADRLLYALRDVTATVESRPLIVSSILSKKLSENLDGLVLDVKVGSGAFMKTEASARWLAESLLEVARAQHVDAVALFTRMDEPLGFKVGNHLEVEECADFLGDYNKTRDPGLFEVTMELAAWMVHLSSRKQLPIESARAECEQELAKGKPFELFKLMFSAQGGDFEAFERQRESLRRDLLHLDFKAPFHGWIGEIKAHSIGLLLNFIGGGRSQKDAPIDPLVGIEFCKKTGDPVHAEEAILTVYHRNPDERAAIERILSDAIIVSPSAGVAKPDSLILGRME